MNIVIAIDSTTYALSAFMIFFIRYKISHEFKPNGTQNSFSNFKIVLENKSVKTILVNYCILGVLVGILIPLLLPYTIDVLKKSNYEYGILMLFFGLGGLIGGITSEQINERFVGHKVIVITFFIETCMMLFWLQFSNFWISSIILMIWGQVVFTRLPAQFNYVSETIKTELLPATHSLLQISFMIPNLFGSLVVVYFGDRYPTFTILKYAGCIFLFLGIIRIISPGVREFYSQTPRKINRKLN